MDSFDDGERTGSVGMVASRYSGRTPACQVALMALEAGISVVPIRPDGTKQPALTGWKRLQDARPTPAEVDAWFSPHPYPHRDRGLALVTGMISGGLIALDFDDAGAFDAWLKRIQRDEVLSSLYGHVASGYEERTPKGGQHLLFRCPEAFDVPRRPSNQKLALRPVSPPQRFETLAETREEGGLIIIDPSRGPVHPSGKPYVRLRGSVFTIRTISATEREQLYASVRTLDEVPRQVPSCVLSPRSPSVSVSGERPGDLFNADLGVTWEALLVGWDLSKPRLNAAGHLERYVRHPGKAGPNHSATINADGTNRLFGFSPSIGLPVSRYLSKFEFFAYWHWGGDFKAAAKALVEQGYRLKEKGILL